jgi:endonuclease I
MRAQRVVDNREANVRAVADFTHTSHKSKRRVRLERVKGLNYDIYGGSSHSGPKNIEHVMPQSNGGTNDPVNEFLVDVVTNELRGNYPYGEVIKTEREIHGFKRGRDQDGYTVVEPPDEFKGDVARVWFYMSQKCHLPIANNTEAVLRQWNQIDPPDARELKRNSIIAADRNGQGNEFVTNPRKVDTIADF